jgi:hypothetical protein
MLVPSFLKRCKDYCIIAHMFQGSKWQAGCSQGFSNVALIGNTLFYSFLGRGGEEEKDV